MVLISETRLTAVAQQVMRAQAGASGWQAFWGAPLESRGEGIWDAPAGGVGILVRQGILTTQILPPKRTPRTETDALAQTLWHSPPPSATSWWAWGGGRIPCTLMWHTAFRPTRPLIGLSGTTPHSTWRATGRPRSWWGEISTLTLITRCEHRRPYWRPF